MKFGCSGDFCDHNQNLDDGQGLTYVYNRNFMFLVCKTIVHDVNVSFANVSNLHHVTTKYPTFTSNWHHNLLIHEYLINKFIYCMISMYFLQSRKCVKSSTYNYKISHLHFHLVSSLIDTLIYCMASMYLMLSNLHHITTKYPTSSFY